MFFFWICGGTLLLRTRLLIEHNCIILVLQDKKREMVASAFGKGDLASPDNGRLEVSLQGVAVSSLWHSFGHRLTSIPSNSQFCSNFSWYEVLTTFFRIVNLQTAQFLVTWFSSMICDFYRRNDKGDVKFY